MTLSSTFSSLFQVRSSKFDHFFFIIKKLRHVSVLSFRAVVSCDRTSPTASNRFLNTILLLSLRQEAWLFTTFCASFLSKAAQEERRDPPQ